MLTLCLLLAAADTTASAPTEPPPSRTRLLYSAALFGRVNPLGLILDSRLTLRHKFFDSDALLLQPAGVSASIQLLASPAFVSVGPHLEITPIGLVRFWAAAHFTSIFPAFDGFRSFASAGSEYGPNELRATQGQRYLSTGWSLFLAAVLQGKVGPVGMRSQLQAAYMDMRMRPGESFFYNQVTDVLQQDRGWVLISDTDVVYAAHSIIAGARMSFVQPLYSGADNANQATNRHLRVGPLLGYQFGSPSLAFAHPTLLFSAQWFVLHRYRAGQQVTQALPQFVLGVQFDGEIWPARH